jgi:hypothetical protein
VQELKIMDVTFTNVSSEQLFLPGPNLDLLPAGTAVATMTTADMDGAERIKELITDGKITAAFVKGPNDDIAVGFPPVPPVFTNGTRPNANTIPVGSSIWNSDDDAHNWSNGTGYFDGVGTGT